MSEQIRPLTKVSKLRQVCIVVRNLEKSMEQYANILGIDKWSVLHFDDSVLSDTTYRGKSVQHPYRAALTMIGPMQLELIQPLEGDSAYSEFLKQHGEGLHHLGVIGVANMDEAIQAFESEGLPCLQSGRITTGDNAVTRYAYIDSAKALGTVIELAQWPERSS